MELALLGIIQGITEWLPISSEGMIVLAQTLLFSSNDSLRQFIELALFLHLGTFFAALFYFRKEVVSLFHTLFYLQEAEEEPRALFSFLLISTVTTGVVGGCILFLLSGIEEGIVLTGKVITVFVGIALLLTGMIQLLRRHGASRNITTLSIKDSIIAGIAQGLSVLPGISRSGITTSVLLLRGVREETALTLSFIMSLPVVLAGNIILNTEAFALNSDTAVALLLSFAFGLLTIHFLLRIARNIPFGYFLIFFALLVIGSVLI